MIEHLSSHATGSAATKRFYASALAPLGYRRQLEMDGAPGLRPAYHEHYYGSFVLDPDGNGVEAVCHLPE